MDIKNLVSMINEVTCKYYECMKLGCIDEAKQCIKDAEEIGIPDVTRTYFTKKDITHMIGNTTIVFKYQHETRVEFCVYVNDVIKCYDNKVFGVSTSDLERAVTYSRDSLHGRAGGNINKPFKVFSTLNKNGGV